MWTQSTSVTEGRTDRRTDRRTELRASHGKTSDTIVIIVMTTAMTKEVCTMVVMLVSARDIWNKLLSIYEQKSGQRLDLLISEPGDSLAQHVTKLENLWTELSQEVLSIEKVHLPLSFLLNRILNTLPNDYFEFRSVWETRAHDQRTVKALTEELCLLEQRLKQRDLTGSTAGNTNVALVAKGDSNDARMASASGGKKTIKVFDKKKVRCYNCNVFGHFASECRAPKSGRDSGGHEPVANVVEGAYSFMCETSQCYSVLSTVDKNVWYADNGATDHMNLMTVCLHHIPSLLTRSLSELVTMP